MAVSWLARLWRRGLVVASNEDHELKVDRPARAPADPPLLPPEQLVKVLAGCRQLEMQDLRIV